MRIEEAASRISQNTEEKLQEKREKMMDRRRELEAVQSGKVEVSVSEVEKQMFIEGTM